MSATAQTAAEAYDRYMAFLGNDALVQSKWHAEADGRQLACALGVLGPEIGSPSDCPAQIMPRWLAQMVPWFFDNQYADDAKDWGKRFYAELKRIDGKVPFTVVYDWQANIIAPLAIEVATMKKRDVAPHEAVRDLHIRALAGDRAPREEWQEKLRDAYAYAYAYAYADAYAYAYAYAYADADADAYAYAYAYAYADAYADADTYANAYANAYADADAKHRVFKRLADGMVACLARVTIDTF